MTIKDEHIWENYTRAVKPTQKKSHKLVTVKSVPDKSAARKLAVLAPVLAPKVTPVSPLKESVSLALERKREKPLRQGSLEINATLDLHGMTQPEAFDALSAFMRRAVKAGKRHLLVVTGKGRAGAGVLRSNLEGWLGQLPEGKQILALRSAAPKHGGGGAFYVILRKK